MKKFITPTAGAPIKNLTNISFPEYQGHQPDPTFIIPNAEVRISGDLQLVEVKHPWARDDEGDRSALFYARFIGLQLVSAWSGSYTFQGILTEVPKFYPSETAEDYPFTGESEGDEWDDNWGHPYTPPEEASAAAFTKKLPTLVLIQQYWNLDYNLDETYETYTKGAN